MGGVLTVPAADLFAKLVVGCKMYFLLLPEARNHTQKTLGKMV